MKVAVFCPHFEDTGGVREVVARAAAAHAAAGHQVHVLSRQRSRDGRDRGAPVPAGYHLWRERLAPAPSRASTLREVRRFVRRFATGARPFVSCLRGIAPDVIATHCSKFYAPWVALAAVATRRPVVVHLHNAERTADGPESVLWSRLLLRSATRVVAVSPAVADYALRIRPALAGRIDVIRNGLDPADFADIAPETRPHPFALAVARLSAQKGIDVLIEALAAAPPGLRVVIAGDGPERRALEAQAARLGVAARIEFLGEVARARVKSLLRGAAFVIMPSRFEGNPLVSLEALQAGAPLIASRIAGLPPELVDGETGILVDPEDPASLAAAMTRLFTQPEEARRLGGAAAREAATIPTWDAVASRILDAYVNAAHST